MTNFALSRESLRTALAAFPRCRLSHLPTPLERLERISARCGVNLFIKRDDQTGLALGGNKSRKLDFVMADVLAQGAGSVITWAGVQSNWCRQLAAASCKLGVHPILLLFTRPRLPRTVDGNLLLDLICDAETHVLELESTRKLMTFDGVKDLIEPLVEKEARAGRKAYVAPIGGSLSEASMRKPLGAIGYVHAFLELLEQVEARQTQIDAVVVATGSGGTQAGLLVGAQLFSPRTKVVGISVSDTREDMIQWVARIAQQTWHELTGTERAFDPQRELLVLDEYLYEGYGIPDQRTIEIIRTVASEEGILLDPVYTGKAFSGFVDLVSKGYFERGQNIVFMHTGGAPGIFAYRDAFQKYLLGDGLPDRSGRSLV